MNDLNNEYAKALFDIALEHKNVDKLKSEAIEIKNILLSNEEYLKILSSAFLSKEARKEKFRNVFRSINEDLISFINVVIDNNRVSELIDILINFISLCNRNEGIIEGIIYSTYRMDEKTLSDIEICIGKEEKTKVHLNNKIDPTLIGGFKVLVNDHQYDNSLLKQVENLKKSLIRR